jgi:hypothetical protein
MTVARRFHSDDVVRQGDAKADRRQHDFEQFFLVEVRSGVLTCTDGEFLLWPAVVIHFEPDTWHRAIFETDTVLIEVNFAKG